MVELQAPLRRENVEIYEKSLSDRSRMLLESLDIGRFRFYQSITKRRREKVSLVAIELKALWSIKLNFPHISDQAISAKIEKLLQEYDYCRKEHDCASLNELFGVTKIKSEWLCKEDKDLCKLQIQSKGHVGYSTGKHAGVQTIHPYKRWKTPEAIASNTATANSSVALDSSWSSSNLSDISEDSSWEDEASPSTSTRRHNSISVARQIVTTSKLSTYRTARLCPGA